MTDRPLVAVEPRGVRDFLDAAVRDGGGDVVEMARAEALVWTDPFDSDGLAQALRTNRGIRWVQLPWAGVEPLLDVIDDDRTWTSGKGVYAEDVAEHALAMALAGLRGIHEYARAEDWGAPQGRNLRGARVTILGAGGIAAALIRLLEPFHCDVTVLRRQAAPVAGARRTGTLEDLPAVAPSTDVLFVALALTPHTDLVVSASVLAALPSHAWIVNVARGRHIDTEALVHALQARAIGGAALDVTDPEPLPPDHPLWRLPSCLITPHIANTPEMAVPVLVARVRENVRRFAEGQPLVGVVDRAAGY